MKMMLDVGGVWVVDGGQRVAGWWLESNWKVVDQPREEGSHVRGRRKGEWMREEDD